MTAEHRFSAALRELVENDERPPCSFDPEMWFGDQADRGLAVELCLGCPLITLCADRTSEMHPRPTDGVFAGVDMSLHPRARQAAAAARRRALSAAATSGELRSA